MSRLCFGFILALALTSFPSMAEDPRFEPPVVVPLAEPLPNAFRIATGDLNGDGKPDLVVGTSAGVVVLLSPADPSSGPGAVIPVDSSCPLPEVALADLDRDGVPDLAVYCGASGQVLIHRGLASGHFGSPDRVAVPSSQAARGIAIADLNQDGTPDVALGQDGQVSVLIGNGDGTFQPAMELKIGGFSSPARPVALVVADFNGDGLPDVATANMVDNDDLSIFLGLGAGRFASEIKILTHDRPHDLVAVDFDRDGNVDLAVACDSGLLLFTGDGRGGFLPGPQLRSDSRPVSVATGDLNGDGLPDFVVGNYYNGSISVVLSGGSGLRMVNSIPSIGDVYAVALLDMNGDSLPDVVASSYSGSSALFAAGRGDGAFDQPMYFGAYPSNSFLVRTADLDGDGQKELAVILQGRRAIKIVHGAEKMTTIQRGDYPLEGVLADFTGDGILDLALGTVPDWRGQSDGDFHAGIVVSPGLGDGTFGPDIITQIERSPASQGYASLSTRLFLMAAGDFDGDGIADLAFVNQPLQELQIYRGNGDGTFTIAQRLPSTFGRALVVADFDGDGVQDLATLEDRVKVYLGNPNGNLIPAGSLDGCQATGTLEMGNFDGDGKPDLLLSCGSEIAVLLNAGGGAFRVASRATRSLPRGAFTYTTAIGDFNGDGLDDVVVASYSGSPQSTLAVQISDGTGSFQSTLQLPTAIDPVSLAALDWDGDTTLDIAAVDASDGTLNIFRNPARSSTNVIEPGFRKRRALPERSSP